MNEKKYSYLPNSYTLKFFQDSNKAQQQTFKPLLLINNIMNKKRQTKSNPKKVRNTENNSKNIKNYTEKQIFIKKNNLLIEKRKKAINMYLKTKSNSNLKTNEEKQKYLYNENYSASSLSKNIPFNPQRKNHSFQNSKVKKKSNIISQIKNEENDIKIKRKLQYCKTDKELNIQTKSENKENNINNNEKIGANKKTTKNRVIVKSNSQNEIITQEERCKTTDKNINKTNKIFSKEIAIKDNGFDIDNLQKEKKINNIASIKKVELPLSDKNEDKNKEMLSFKPNMNIFKNTNFNNFKNMSGKKDNKAKEKINKANSKKNKNYIIEKINDYKKDKKGKKNNKSENDKDANYKINSIEKDNNCKNNNINNNRPLNMIEVNKPPINSELAQFTFKNEAFVKDNNQHSSIITEKRKNELKKLINFTNKF